ncbi:MAG: bifunctional phosphoribosylaminoimidazolecarboxamide formyltransferase/IMP cyclohydrolase [Bacillota bacterium]
MKVARALLSVYRKEGLLELAQGLHELGIELLSTGGTARLLAGAGLPVKSVSEEGGFPEILDGRVKTLQPRIHGAILAVRDNPEHQRQLAEHGITPIDLVVVNLYPFRETVARPGVTLEEAIENIDIGGPTMVRAAAKNHAHVGVVVNPDDYPAVLAELRQTGGLSAETRSRLARLAFRHTHEYDAAIVQYLEGLAEAGEAFPAQAVLSYEKLQELRYGENPHQRGALYIDPRATGPVITRAEQLHGKEMSYCNVFDADAALELVKEFSEPAAVAIKHANPCGVAVGPDLFTAYRRCYESDPVSIFGGIVAFNRTLDLATAQALSEILADIVIAPDYQPEALELLRTKKKNLRILRIGPLDAPVLPTLDFKRVGGGLILQEPDIAPEEPETWTVPTKVSPTKQQLDDLKFAWTVAKHVKSNAIVLVKDRATIGVGAGQLNRINAARLAIWQAGEKARGAVLASDAFMPFPDVVETAAEAGIAAVIQPGGSLRDNLSISLCDEKGLAMVFTGRRHFRH